MDKKNIGLFICYLFLGAGIYSQPTIGTDFWFAFTGNNSYYLSPQQNDCRLYISSPINTTCTVSLSNLSYSQNFNITANTTLVIDLLASYNPVVLSNQLLENMAVHVSSSAPVTLYAGHAQSFAADASLIYPTPYLGTEYRIGTYQKPGNTNPNIQSEFVLVGIENNTTVEIIPSTVTSNGNAAGIPFIITLQQGQTYQVKSPGDLTGSTIKYIGPGCKKFAVFAGHNCADIPVGYYPACNYIYEQIPDLSKWGTNFVLVPYLTRSADTYRIIAHLNGTAINISGVGSYNLNAGQMIEFMTSGAAKWINSNQPILVTQFSHGTTYDSVPGDPSFLVVPPLKETSGNSLFRPFNTIPTNINSHYVNIVTKTTNTNGIWLDGTLIPPGNFQLVTGNPFYSFVQKNINGNTHKLYSDQSYTATVYGFGEDDAYSYALGNMISIDPQVIFLNDTVGALSFTDTLDCINHHLSVFIDSLTAVQNVYWDFGDQTSFEYGWQADHIYNQPGTYTITLHYEFPGVCDTENDSISFPVIFINSSPDLIHDTIICPGDSLTWTIPTGSTGNVTWWDGSNDTTRILPPGFYYFFCNSSNGCSFSDTATISAYNLQSVLPNDTSICFPNTFIISADPLAISYLWNDNSTDANMTITQPGTYSVYLNYGACAANDTIVVEDFIPFIVNLGNDTVICEGQSICIDAGFPLAQHVWNTNSNTQSICVQSEDIYWVEVSIDNCTETDSIYIAFISPPGFSLGPDKEICLGDSILVNANLINATTYQWNLGLTPTSSHYIDEIGTYIVEVTVPPCVVTDTIEINLKTLPYNVVPDSLWFCTDDSIVVTTLFSNASFVWSTGSTGTTEIFYTSQTAVVSAFLNNCAAIDTIDIYELPCDCQFFAPNSFTPNNDHMNEVFKPVICSELDFYSMKIFDRWGKEIFSTNDPNEGWNGTYSGMQTPQGVYIYLITYDSYGVFEYQKTKYGTVNLIR